MKQNLRELSLKWFLFTYYYICIYWIRTYITLFADCPYKDRFLFSTGSAVPDVTDAARRRRSLAEATQDDGGARPCTCGDSTCCSCEWRFGYRKSEYDIEVPSVSAFFPSVQMWLGVWFVVWCTSRRGRVPANCRGPETFDACLRDASTWVADDLTRNSPSEIGA